MGGGEKLVKRRLWRDDLVWFGGTRLNVLVVVGGGEELVKRRLGDMV